MIIGITGKSGSGKTTMANQIHSKLNLLHINIDIEFHNLIENKLINETAELFGWDCFDHNCKLINRKVIGDKIFANRNNKEHGKYIEMLYKGLLQYLNERIFPAYDSLILDHILLPHMKELWSICDTKILVVNKYDSLRKKAVMKRDNITEEYFNKRESASIEYDSIYFDYIIENQYTKTFVITTNKEIL
jgi:dephospho-CoA kinase